VAATVLTVYKLDRTAGVLIAGTAATVTQGDAFDNTGKEFLLVTNAHGSIDTTVSFALAQTLDGLTAGPRTVSVVHGTSRLIGPFPASVYNNADGRVTAICSSVDLVTVKAFQLVAEP
jgi:hypothetical protein